MTQEEVDLIYDYLHENYRYEDGELISNRSGKAIGTITVKGSAAHVGWQIKIKGKPVGILVQSMIYLYHTKLFNKFFDFADNNPMNLSIENLIPLAKRRRIGLGVSRCGEAFRATVVLNRKSIHLGQFKDEIKATEAFEYAKRLIDLNLTASEIKKNIQIKFQQHKFNNKRLLPIGVYRKNNKKGDVYISYCDKKYVGTFGTPEEAHAAYLKAKAELS